jgi:uncharacterized caspase-like protein
MELVELLPGEDACMFAFIGHGIEVQGTNYLVPCDATLGEERECVVYWYSIQ